MLQKKSRIFWELRPGGTDIWKGMDIVLPDIRTLMYPARTGRIYGEMAKMEFRGIADDPLEIQDPSDRR